MKTNRKILHKTLMIILLGTALEYYDIALFAFIAPLLAKIFLPDLSATSATIIMYITYGLGLIARPYGANFFGKMGDKYGRVKPLYITTIAMAILSATISIIPNYQMLGLGSLVLFTILRTLQQFFVSGNFNGGAIYCIEHASGIYKPGFISGIYNAATVAGIVFAATIAMLIAHFGAEYWRIGYLVGAMSAIIGVVMRKHLCEPPDFYKVSKDPKPKKISVLFTISITLISLYFGVLYAFSAKVLNVIIPEISHFTLEDVLRINLYVTACYFFLLVFGGWLADFIGVKRQMLIIAIIAIPVVFYVSCIKYDTLFDIFWAKFVIIAMVAMFFGPAHSYFVSELAIHKRYRVISVLYTIGKLIAGFAPAIFLASYNLDRDVINISYIIALIGCVTASVIFVVNRRV